MNLKLVARAAATHCPAEAGEDRLRLVEGVACRSRGTSLVSGQGPRGSSGRASPVTSPEHALACLLLGVVVVLLIAAPATGWTQQAPAPAEIVEPQLPQDPQSPTDFQGPAQLPTGGIAPASIGGGPVSPPPPASPSDRPGLQVEAEGAVSGYSGGDMIVDEANPALYGLVRPRQQAVPTSHTVKEGDTLWGICAHYYGDPWVWPQVWALNPEISNPHWIYPGDKVRLLKEQAVAAKPRAEGEESIKVVGQRTTFSGDIQLQQNGFVDPKELERAGKIVASVEERIMLSQGDEIYIEGGEGFKPAPGQSYSIFRVRRELKSPDGDFIGNLVEILGHVRIKRVQQGKRVSAVITESLAPIERGHRLGPIRRRFVRVATRPAGKSLEGQIIASLRQSKYLATEELVVVSRGTRDGVQVGNRFLVVQRGDGYERLLKGHNIDAPELPWEPVAEVTVVDARESASIGLVTRAVKEIQEGDHLRMRHGY